MMPLRFLFAAVVLVVVASAPTIAQVVPKQPPLPKDVHPMYQSIKLMPGTIHGKGPFKVGDTIKVSFHLQNIGSKEVVFPAVGLGNRSEPSPGSEQAWFERLGKDSRIAAYDPKAAKRGSQYAAGGSIITGKEKLAPQEKLDLLRERPIDTANYPPGTYRFILEIQDEKGRVIQQQAITFELKAAR